MKLTALILIITCMHVSAHSYSQTISFSGKNVPLQAVFASIEKQTGLSFFFNMALIKDTKPVTLDLRDVTLETALHEVLKDQGLDFYRMGKTIFIIKKQMAVAVVDSPLPGARLTDVKGRVINQQGEALAGATVAVKNGKKAALTDEKGGFELKGVAVGAMLEITYLGYERKEVQVEGGEIGRVEMVVASNKLDEVQIIAYGNTTERLGTGNVSTVKGEDIAKQPVNNPLLALEGRVPGMFITQNTGLAGSGVTVSIQGPNSITKGNDPLYVINGVPYISELLPNLGGILGTSSVNTNYVTSGSPLSYINPADIENISILKDADATAIYGSRAANGAILITTKKGKAGVTKLDINLQQGLGKMTRKLDLMNTQQYMQMRRQTKRNDISAIGTTDYDLNGLWDTTKYTDWQKVLLGGTAQYTNLNASISGGTANTQYLIGSTYHRETTVFPDNFSDQKGSVYININNSSSDQKFHIQLSGTYLVDNNRLPGTDLTSTAILTPPVAPNLYNADGTLNWALAPSGFSSWPSGNPLSYLLSIYNSKSENLISNSLLSYQLLKGLEIKASVGYTNLQTDEYKTMPLISYQPAIRSLVSRTANYVNNTIHSWLIEPQITYRKNIGEGRLDILIGSTINQLSSKGQQLLGTGYNSDLVLEDIHSAATVTVSSNVQTLYKYNAAFGRVSYNWEEKYLLNLTARRDGSSRFGPANEFHNFGAVGAGWVFSKEDFIQNNLRFISFGKLRGSYGTTGNDQINDYAFLNQYNPISVAVPYQGISVLAPNSLSNPYLQWEETKKLEIGMDLGLFHERILVNANYFRNRSSNELLSSPLPVITGFTSIPENLPATVQNSGYELSLNTINFKKNYFSWSSNINLTIPQNKLLAYPGLSTSTNSLYIIGQPITIKKLYHYLGIDPATGKYMFADFHGNPTSTPSSLTDVTSIFNSSPQFYGGFENEFRYKGFELDVLFQFVKQKGKNYFFGNVPGAISNQPRYVLNSWQKPGDITSTQRFNGDQSIFQQFSNATSSDAAYTDASFIRLKNVSLSYQFAQKLYKKAHLEYARIYIQGQNLLTFTKYKGLDPENKSTSSLPPLSVLTAGIQIGL